MKTLLIKLDKDCTGSELRMFELIQHLYWIDGHYQDTWCKLFKTKGYQRANVHAEKTRERIIKQVQKLHPTATWWEVDMMGSKRLLDVQAKRRQSYLLTLKFS